MEVTSVNFEKEVLRSELPVVVDFFATWCGPCKMLVPVLDALAEEMPNVKFLKINVDNAPELAQRYGVDSIPSLFFIKGGSVVGNTVGYMTSDQLKPMIEEAFR